MSKEAIFRRKICDLRMLFRIVRARSAEQSGIKEKGEEAHERI